MRNCGTACLLGVAIRKNIKAGDGEPRRQGKSVQSNERLNEQVSMIKD